MGGFPPGNRVTFNEVNERVAEASITLNLLIVARCIYFSPLRKGVAVRRIFRRHSKLFLDAKRGSNRETNEEGRGDKPRDEELEET